MQKLFSNLKINLTLILILQLTYCFFRLYFEFLNIQWWFNLFEKNPKEFEEIEFSYLKIIINFILPIIFCLGGICGVICILNKRKIGYFLGLLFWIINFIILIISSINFDGNLFNEKIEYLYFILIFGINSSIIIYYSKKIKQLYFNTL